ncbi:hypothetical protein J6590_022740 [Homalodisca vitripennis]|nr:hypothetical protein J6590_022740 [Homalodisca vitripennis]
MSAQENGGYCSHSSDICGHLRSAPDLSPLKIDLHHAQENGGYCSHSSDICGHLRSAPDLSPLKIDLHHGLMSVHGEDSWLTFTTLSFVFNLLGLCEAHSWESKCLTPRLTTLQTPKDAEMFTTAPITLNVRRTSCSGALVHGLRASLESPCRIARCWAANRRRSGRDYSLFSTLPALPCYPGSVVVKLLAELNRCNSDVQLGIYMQPF